MLSKLFARLGKPPATPAPADDARIAAQVFQSPKLHLYFARVGFEFNIELERHETARLDNMDNLMAAVRAKHLRTHDRSLNPHHAWGVLHRLAAEHLEAHGTDQDGP